MPAPYFNPVDFKDKTKRDEDYAIIAASTVQTLAPAPAPEPADYPGKARAAERLVYNWLQATSGGANTSEGLAGISSGFAQLPQIREIVRGQMGPYFTGGVSVGGDANTATIGLSPW